MKKNSCIRALYILSAFVALSGCASPTIRSDTPAVETAKQEMRRRGWKKIELERCVFREGVWVVDLYKPSFKGGVNFASVKVSPNGSVLDVFENLK